MRINRYFRILWWLVKDVYSKYPRSFIMVVSFGTLGLMMQGGVFLALVAFGSKLANDSWISFLDISVYSRAVPVLFFAAICTLLGLSISSYLLYLQQKILIETGFIYELNCNERIFALGNKKYKQKDRYAEPLDDLAMMRIGVTDSSLLNRIVRILMLTPVHMITFMVSSIGLFFLSVKLTIIILPVSLFTAYRIYKLNIKAASLTLLFERLNPDAVMEKRGIYHLLKESSKDFSAENMYFKDALRNDVIMNCLKANLERIVLPQKAQLIVGVLLAVSLAIIILYYGVGPTGADDYEHWGSLVAYLLALRYCLMSLKSISGQFTSLNRFYPNLRRYYESLPFHASGKGELVQDLVITPNSTLGETGHNLSYLGKGTRVGLVSSVELNRYTLGYLINSVSMNSNFSFYDIFESSVFVSYRRPLANNLSDLSLYKEHQNILVNNSMTCKELKEIIDSEILSDWLLEQLPVFDMPDKKLSDLPVINNLLLFVISIIEKKTNNKQFIFVDELGIRQLPNRIRVELLDELSSKTVFLNYSTGNKTVSRYHEDVVMILDNFGVVAMLSRENALLYIDEINQIISRERNKKSSNMADNMDTEELFA